MDDATPETTRQAILNAAKAAAERATKELREGADLVVGTRLLEASASAFRSVTPALDAQYPTT